jgi:hypothetical protein
MSKLGWFWSRMEFINAMMMVKFILETSSRVGEAHCFEMVDAASNIPDGKCD